MNLVEFSELIVKKLVKEPDLVKVQLFEGEEEDTIEILVSENDMGRVIGKKGKISKLNLFLRKELKESILE